MGPHRGLLKFFLHCFWKEVAWLKGEGGAWNKKEDFLSESIAGKRNGRING